MTIELITAICLTIGISALCSTLEAMILSITSAEIEAQRKKPRKLLESFKVELEKQPQHIESEYNSEYPRCNFSRRFS